MPALENEIDPDVARFRELLLAGTGIKEIANQFGRNETKFIAFMARTFCKVGNEFRNLRNQNQQKLVKDLYDSVVHFQKPPANLYWTVCNKHAPSHKQFDCNHDLCAKAYTAIATNDPLVLESIASSPSGKKLLAIIAPLVEAARTECDQTLTALNVANEAKIRTLIRSLLFREHASDCARQLGLGAQYVSAAQTKYAKIYPHLKPVLKVVDRLETAVAGKKQIKTNVKGLSAGWLPKPLLRTWLREVSKNMGDAENATLKAREAVAAAEETLNKKNLSRPVRNEILRAILMHKKFGSRPEQAG